jgi:hypothetical protein
MMTKTTMMIVGALAATGWLGAQGVAAQDAARGESQEMRWTLDGEALVVDGTGGSTLRFRSGTATLLDTSLRDGSVSFTIKAPGARSFVGLRFRTGEDGSYEDFYLRPHKDRAPDALQYTPSFSGADTNWQIFHGPAGTAPAPTQDAVEGIDVEVVFEDRDLAVFVGDGAEPAMRVTRLALEPRGGGLTFWSNVLQPTDHERPVVLQNIRVSSTGTRPLPAAESVPTPEGAVLSWGVGAAFHTDRLAEQVPDDVRFRPRPSEPDGTLLIDRHVERPDGEGVPAVAAGITIHADQAGRVKMELGFSDLVTVFLNGVPLYQGDLRYSYTEPMRQGFFQPDQNTLYLPLEAGRNELVAVVVESFGGWALAARFPEGDVRTEPLDGALRSSGGTR